MSVTQFPPAGPPLEPGEPEYGDGWDADRPKDRTTVTGGDSRARPPLPREMLTFEVDFEEAAPIPFAIHFRNTRLGIDELHEFEAEGDPGAGGLLASSSLVRYTPQGQTMVDLNAMLVFFERVLVGDGYERLRALLGRRDLKVPTETLGQVFSTLVERYSGRPLGQPQPSRAARRHPGR